MEMSFTNSSFAFALSYNYVLDMRIPEDKIEEIRNSSSIVDIISAYVPLKKRGRNFIGNCPFHTEKTPSFTVSDEKSIYHCFGCHVGGNVFKFLMEYKSISFVEAVEEVADHIGIKLDYEKGYSQEANDEIEALYDINILAARFFSNNLLKSAEGEGARKYLENRKIKVQTQRNFGVGYAPDKWDGFFNYARDNKADLAKAKDLGLLDAKDGGSYYDKFRDRVIFPIFSPNGRVIGFGGRVLQKDQKTAKYLNSPESIVYHKRKTLYGLYHSKDEIRRLDKAILVEGYMDLISLYQNGVKNVVASSGTALTEEQVQLLSRFTKNIIILFDADAAGQSAALRSIEVLLKQDFEVKILSLPEGEDPDSFINTNHKDDFDRLVNNATNFMEYQTEQFEKKGMLSDPDKQSQAIRELVKTIALISDELKRTMLLKDISRKFNLREMLLEKELEKYLSANQNVPIPQPQVQSEQESKEAGSGKSKDVNRAKRFELDIIRLLLSDEKKIVGYIFDHIHPDEIVNEKLKSVASVFFEAFKKGTFQSALLLDLIEEKEIQTFFRSLTIDGESISKKFEGVKKDSIEYAIELVRNYELFKIDSDIRENNELIKNADSDTDVRAILEKVKELQEKKKKIFE